MATRLSDESRPESCCSDNRKSAFVSIHMSISYVNYQSQNVYLRIRQKERMCGLLYLMKLHRTFRTWNRLPPSYGRRHLRSAKAIPPCSKITTSTQEMNEVGIKIYQKADSESPHITLVWEFFCKQWIIYARFQYRKSRNQHETHSTIRSEKQGKNWYPNHTSICDLDSQQQRSKNAPVLNAMLKNHHLNTNLLNKKRNEVGINLSKG